MMDPGLLLSMLLVPQFVNGAEPAVQASTASVTFESILRRVTAQGKDKNFEGLKRFPQIPKGSPTKVEWGFSKDAEDGHRRLFSVILDRSTETPKAAYVELYVEHKDMPARKVQSFYFLLGLYGSLKECGTTEGPLDEKGKMIPNAAFSPFRSLEIKSPEARALFQRELDFWVKGVGRKPAAAHLDGGAETPHKAK